jgi:hypothetical protein
MRRTIPIFAAVLSLTLPKVFADTKEDTKELAAKQKKAVEQKAEATRLIAAVTVETDEAAKNSEYKSCHVARSRSGSVD